MITLLSDFGYQDAYVAVMKGVIAAIAPAEITCDLTHAVSPQDILAARFHLKLAYPHFPSGTVHLAVVDPGVGSARRALAVHCSKASMSCTLVGPDNGILSGVIEDFMADSQTGKVTAVALNHQIYWRSGLVNGLPSHTFHGRDIFAPVAAHLANGVALEALGDRISPDSLIKSDLRPFTPITHLSSAQSINSKIGSLTPPDKHESAQSEHITSKLITLGIGCIQHVDTFGNLISNIPEHAVANTAWEILIETPLRSVRLPRIKTYSDASIGDVAALIGSHGWIEIACNRGSAAAALNEWGGALVGTTLKAIAKTAS